MMDTFLSILSKLGQITAAIICWILSVVIFCLSKLKDLLEQNDKHAVNSEYITRQELFSWLDEYFSKKDLEKSNADKDKDTEKRGYKINSNFDDLFI
jgi:hypothetical protein